MRIFVGGLSFRTPEEKLRKAALFIGADVESVQIVTDASGESKRYGFIETDEAGAKLLVAARGFMLDGVPLRFERAKAPKAKPVLSGGREW